MSMALVVYLIGILATLKGFLVAWFIFLLIVAFIITFITFMEGKAIFNTIITKYKKQLKGVFISALVTIGLLTIIPDKNDMYIIAGLYIGEQVITSEKGSAIIDKSYQAIMTKLDDVITENTKEPEPEK